MFSKPNRMFYPILMIGLLGIIVGCRQLPSLREPLLMDDSFDPKDVTTITILPVIDLRVDKKLGLDFKGNVQDVAIRCLRKRGYTATSTDVQPQSANLTEADFKKPTPEWVQSLPPTDARWIMLFSVGDVTKGTTLVGHTSDAELSAFLYDKQAAKCVWYNRGLWQEKPAGWGVELELYSLHGSIGNRAIANATRDALSGLPEKP
jgi:hypothetical protein